MKIRFAPLAAEDIEVADRWWLANRVAAPALFEDELRLALRLIEEHPLAGSRIWESEPRLAGVRRVMLGATRFLLYYRVLGDTVEVLRVYQSNRGDRPQF